MKHMCTWCYTRGTGRQRIMADGAYVVVCFDLLVGGDCQTMNMTPCGLVIAEDFPTSTNVLDDIQVGV